MKSFNHINASCLEEASAAVANGAKVIAGGTDLLGILKNRLLTKYPETLVNIKSIDNGAYIKDMGDSIAIGALTTLADIEASELIKSNVAALSEAAHSVATPIIRNSATIGGNVCQDVRCWYFRYPNSIGGRLNCARKGGKGCYAVQGRNQYHSIMGGMKAGGNACSNKCPAGTDISAYMSLIRQNDWDGAAEIIMQYNPLPTLTARVCPHTCQSECNQCATGDSVNIHAVERTLGDYILTHADKFYAAPKTETGKKISIVGAGPAGLSAAYYLRKLGHTVVIYDKMEEAGGILMYGIPEYRLPKHYVRDVVAAIKNMGVQFIFKTEVGKDIALDDIKAKSDAVFLDTGAWKQPILGIEGEHLTQFGLNFLVEVKTFMSRQIGKEVLVCGGGNVAMDVALTAVRLGAQKVRLVCLEQRDEMPASAEEIHRAEEEGVEIHNGWGLGSIISDDNQNVKGLKAKRCLSVRNAKGRFAPTYNEKDTCVFNSDCIILATGQKVDLDFLGSRKEELKNSRNLIGVDNRMETRAQGIFAGGDATNGPSLAIIAVRDGAAAARSINRFVGGTNKARKTLDGFLTYDVDGVQARSAHVEPDTPVAERSLAREDSASLSMDEAKAEACRCMNCGCYSVNASDISNVLLALDATIRTTKKSIPARTFFSAMDSKGLLNVGEIVTEIVIPKMAGYQTGYLKMRLRESIDFAITALAYAYKRDGNKIIDARLAAGGIAPIPLRLEAVEKLLKSSPLTDELIDEAAKLATADATPMKENAYKIVELQTQVKRSLKA